MNWVGFLLIIIAWSLFGGFVACLCIDSDGFEYVNPIWIYKRYWVNYFGAALLCIVYNLLCPIGSVYYWIYKLCTIGRR